MDKSLAGSGDNVGETQDDLGKWALTDNDESTVDEVQLRGWHLEVLRLLGDRLDVRSNLVWSGGSQGWDGKGRESRSGNRLEGDHSG